MDIRARHYDDVAILSVNGRLDAETIAQFSQSIREQMAAGYHRLVIDLNQVDFLSHPCVTTLIQGAQQTRGQGGDFRIANARAQVKQALAGIDGMIQVYPHVIGATASYFPGPITKVTMPAPGD